MAFLNDRPIENLTDDILWAETDSIRVEIRHIVEAITESLNRNAPPSESLTFAVYGRWGMGKSSALRLIRHQAECIAADKNLLPRLRFCEYNAAMNEALCQDYGYNVRTTLGLQVIRALADSPEQLTDLLLQHMPDVFTGAVNSRSMRESDQIALPRALQEVVEAVSRLVEFDRVIDGILDDTQTGRPILAVFIDDLDRCGSEFVWQVLTTIQQWGSIRDVFFFLAMDRDHLHRSLGSQFAAAEEPEQVDYALEKYIQHSISVPPLDEARLEKYLKALSTSEGFADTASTILSSLASNAALLRFGLRVQTPRSVKRFINTAWLDLEQHLGEIEDASGESTRRFVKEHMLDYSWPTFYSTYYRPAKMAQQVHGRMYYVFISLEQICAQFSADRDEPRLRFELNRLSQQMEIEFGEVSVELAHYLGLRPHFFLDDESKAARPLPSSWSWKTGQVTGQEVEPPPGRGELTDKLRQMLFDTQAALMDRSSARLRETCQQALELVIQNEAAFRDESNATASTLGDIASNAARSGSLDVAVKLFQLVLTFTAEPEVESNNLGNFLALVLSRGMDELLPEAEVVVRRIRSPELAGVDSARTAALVAGFNAMKQKVAGDTDGADVSVDDDVLASFFDAPADDMLFAAVSLMSRNAGDTDTLKRCARARYQAVEDPDDAYEALRVLADGLAPAGEEDGLVAMQIYKFILDNVQCRSKAASRDSKDVKFNLGVLLYAGDYDDEAGRLWFEAYQDMPDSSAMRRTYSEYLARARRPELASRASRGEPIEEMVLQASRKEVPSRFLSEDVHCWWEERQEFGDECA